MPGSVRIKPAGSLAFAGPGESRGLDSRSSVRSGGDKPSGSAASLGSSGRTVWAAAAWKDTQIRVPLNTRVRFGADQGTKPLRYSRYSSPASGPPGGGDEPTKEVTD